MTTLDSIIGGIQGIASGVGSGINAVFNYKNYELQRQNYNYQRIYRNNFLLARIMLSSDAQQI